MPDTFIVAKNYRRPVINFLHSTIYYTFFFLTCFTFKKNHTFVFNKYIFSLIIVELDFQKIVSSA